jgi:hypothetical protein
MSIDFPREEERILARWKEIDAFLRQVELVSVFLLHLEPKHDHLGAFLGKQDALRSREFLQHF